MRRSIRNNIILISDFPVSFIMSSPTCTRFIRGRSGTEHLWHTILALNCQLPSKSTSQRMEDIRQEIITTKDLSDGYMLRPGPEANKHGVFGTVSHAKVVGKES